MTEQTKFLLLPCLLLISVYSFSVRSELTIYTEEFPPYNYSEHGVIRGINIDILKLACTNANIQCAFEIYPWKRAMFLTLKDPNSGLVSTSRTPSRENMFKWVGPLVSSTACLFKLKKRKDIQVSKREELLEYTIGLQKGDVYEDILKSWGFVQDQNYIASYEKYSSVKAFVSGKLDLFIASATTLEYHFKSSQLSRNKIEPIYVISDSRLQGNFLALNKLLENEVVERLQKEVNSLIENDRHLTIKKSYVDYASEFNGSGTDLAKRCFYI